MKMRARWAYPLVLAVVAAATGVILLGPGHAAYLLVLASLLFGGLAVGAVRAARRLELRRGELEAALVAERERASRSALLGQIVQELRPSLDEASILETAVDGLGRAIGASRVVVYRLGSGGTYRICAQFAAGDAAVLDENATLPVVLVHDPALAEQLSKGDPASTTDPDLGALARRLGVRSLVTAPIGRADPVDLALTVHYLDEAGPASEEDIRFVHRFATQLASVLRQAELYRRQARTVDVRSSLLRVAQALWTARESRSLLELATSVGAPLAGARASAVLVEADQVGLWRVAKEHGLLDRITDRTLEGMTADLERALRERAPVHVGEGSLVGRSSASGFGAVVLVPLFYGREPLGVFLFERREEGPWRPEEVEDARVIAELTASALKNAQLFEELSTSEARYRDLQEQLQHSQKLELIGALSGGVAHDFNNLLGGIMGYASLLRTHLEDDPAAMRYVETIERSAVRGAELTSRLLTVSRRRPARREAVELNSLVEETLDLLSHTFHKNVRFEARLDPRLRPILADASQLQQIVLNLCVNARDAMPGGGTLRVSTRLESEDRVILSVADSGVGMEPAVIERLFEPFFSTKGEGGTGLGLSVVYGIVNSLGGDVRVQSAPGRGATFDVSLPCQWAELASAETRGIEPLIGQGELILIVDDEQILRDLGKEILESHGYRVEAVESGSSAVDFVRKSRGSVALVILDVVMPGLDGGETYRRLRNVDARLPVLLSSGLNSEEGIQEILAEERTGFIPKPYGIAELTQAVATALAKRGRPSIVH